MINEKDQNPLIWYIGIAIAAALLFIPLLGQVHLFDWDEINFAESAREMIAGNDYLNVKINFISFYEKPPLFIWMQVVSMKIFGVNEFAARFPNAICGIVTLLILYHAGRKVAGHKFAITWTMVYAGSLLPFMYFKSGIIDPWFNLFIFAGIFEVWQYIQSHENRIFHLSLSALFIGLAVLTKGPVGLLIYGLSVGIYLLINKFRIRTSARDLVAFAVILTFVGGLWFILQIVEGNFDIIADFIRYQVRLFSTHGAGHRGFVLYHFVVLLFGVFPASMFAIPVIFGFRKAKEEKEEFLRWMLILFWVVLILFTIVKTKIVHYSSMCYFPLTFMAAWWIQRADEDIRMKKALRIMILVTGILLVVLISLLTQIENFKALIIPKIKDPFAAACLAADAGWRGYELVVSFVLFTAVILFAIFWDRQKKVAVYLLTSLVMIFMFLSMYLITPRIEKYSQRAAIDFFSSVKDENAYLLTLGYKSYAHYFYGRIKESRNPASRDENWLLTGLIDKPVYISAKAFKTKKYLSKYPDLQVIYQKNGFVFFKRVPKTIP